MTKTQPCPHIQEGTCTRGCRGFQCRRREDLHPNHLPDLRYALMVLEKVRDLVVPTFHKDDTGRGEVLAAITGMRYIIERTEQAQRTAGVGGTDGR